MKIQSLPKISFAEYLSVEKSFYNTASHLTMRFGEYLLKELYSKCPCCRALTSCKSHHQVYVLCKQYLIDWSL